MDRYTPLTDISIRPPQAVLPENEPSYKEIYAQAKVRVTVEGQTEMEEKLEQAIAAGEPGLLRQAVPNYVTDEARVRSFVDAFGVVTTEGDAQDRPEFTIPEPDDIKIVTVAVTGGRGGARRRKVYSVIDSQETGNWKEFQTEPAEIPFVNPFYPRKRALIEANVADKMAYFARKELDNIAWTLITDTAIKTSFGANKIYSFKDADVTGIPTGNSKTSSDSFWKTLRTTVIPYFQGIGMADRVIQVHILHTDLQFLYGVAPLGNTLGGYSDFQQKIYEAGVRDVEIYGHRFRIIPQNWKVATGQMYCNAGPVYKMWLPRTGSVARRIIRDDTSEYRSLHRVYEVLSPSIWWKNVLKSTWNTSVNADS